ncbi:carbohydrate ABC transporter permease [Lichenibacterium ramalinae]|uniref:Carbohydrate ABC transporter permease n=1 Tax=Lichenibacterium ramalinae TaxID=2316527 RepID=A0A4Q2R426_9HYPH|nr:carbohydrate ABC transporter permease [Lichenibacterium ramalinae]
MTARHGPVRRLSVGVGVVAIVGWSAGPFLWQLSTSFQDDKALTAATPSLWPSPGTWEHYYNVFAAKHFQLYVLNSVVVAGLTTIFCLAIGALAAFSLSRLRIRHRFGILIAILSVSMFPQIALVGPLYLLASALGLLDTYASLVIAYMALGLPLVTWVLFGYFETFPRELDEAARMDGIGPIGLLVRIILPLSAPALVTVGLLAFIAAWNEFMFALAFTSTIDHQTIPVGIANFTDLYYVPWGDIAAASVVVTLPLIALVLVFQRHIVEGLTQGAVKG